ncbi:MAG: hypothetical protein J6M90_04620 [Oscillospiraceae bacterium]|nr:hypothetical protein [Oscillospiraceae bacterium]MBQ9208972.1 hypothetical protein [Oscillospiraceae bacterium]
MANVNQQRTGTSRSGQMNIRPGMGGAVIIAALILGICIIIAASTVSSSVKKLCAAVEGQTFTSSYTAPSNLSIKTGAEKRYFTEEEAAAYLSLDKGDITDAIKSGDINEYVKTSSGYVISAAELDDYFSTKAYDQYRADHSEE